MRHTKNIASVRQRLKNDARVDVVKSMECEEGSA